MTKIIRKIFPFLFRKRDDISLENKLTNILMFIGAFICYLGFIINYFNGFSLQQNWMIGLGGIAYSVLFYYSSYKNFTKQLEVPFQIVSVLLLIYSWQTTDGIHGSTTNFFYIVTFALIYCSSKKKYWITFGFLTSISVLLVLGQLYLPSLIIPYSDNKTQINDITSGFVLAVFTFGIFTILVKKSFDSERLKSEQRSKELQESEMRYRDLFENSPIGIYRTTPDGAIITANPALLRMMGFSSLDECLKRNLEQGTYTSYTRNEFKKQIERDGSITGLEAEWYKTDNTPLFVCENARVVRDNSGKILYYDGTIEDITERKKIESELIKSKEKAEESDMLKSAFLANMSHEIRTPLNSIVGFSKIIAKKGADCVDNPEEMASIIDFNSNVLIQIIDDIIDLSKIESGVIHINKEPVNIDELLTNLLSVNEMAKKNLKRDNLELKYNRNNIKGSVIADKIRLGQIINNLISNALKYTEQGVVEFGYDIIENKIIQFYVKDSGIGIPESDASMIFTRFYKAKNEITTYRGIGLGLPITKQLVEKMNGEIWFESQLNKGTIFYFTLPYIQTEKITTEKLLIKNNSDLKNKTILIADDDDGNYLLAKMLLNEYGATVIRAENGQEAVQKCKEDNTINLVLMDMKMPIMDGMEATRLIKKFRSDLIIIALSANVFDEAKQTALSAGCDYFISKPINEKQLIELL